LLDEVTQTINQEKQPKPRVIKPKPPVSSKKASRRAPEIDMVAIPAGSFTMGCQDSRDKDCDSDEKPTHTVSISAFELGKTEVTQGQWKAVMGNNPSNFSSCGDNCPVEQVSWDDVQVFIQKLNAQTGKTYRLPSESEWEYACRAGQSSNYCGGDNVDSVAWYGYEKSGKTTHPVGKKDANAWGLYDMSGNVYEWVQDGKHSDYNGAPSDSRVWSGATDRRVLRGGSWNYNARLSRAANRNDSTPTVRVNNVGFRLARTPQ
jgi:formylglycine-generating enzyme required for sulfatase activity